MESDSGTSAYKAFPMNAGDAEYSYAQNSTYQRTANDITQNIIKETILEKLDLQKLLQHSSNVFRIADLGCSIGPNTFFTVQNLIDAVNLKFQSLGHGSDSLEFQVFFNDLVDNDFNTLLKSLPEDKQYYAAAVPGSFHGRLFPESSIHVFNSTHGLHWLSRVPRDVVDKNSPAYNKGRFYFTNDEKEVAEAYSAQFARDMESFLNSRALEIVPGGIMIFVILCVPPNSLNNVEANSKIMGDVFLEMSNQGLIGEELVDSYNIPFYTPASEEVKELIKKNGNFTIEKSELLCHLFSKQQKLDAHGLCLHMRATCEGSLKEHFGEDVVDEFFIQYEKELMKSTFLTDPSYKELGELFIIKRNVV